MTFLLQQQKKCRPDEQSHGRGITAKLTASPRWRVGDLGLVEREWILIYLEGMLIRGCSGTRGASWLRCELSFGREKDTAGVMSHKSEADTAECRELGAGGCLIANSAYEKPLLLGGRLEAEKLKIFENEIATTFLGRGVCTSENFSAKKVRGVSGQDFTTKKPIGRCR